MDSKNDSKTPELKTKAHKVYLRQGVPHCVISGILFAPKARNSKGEYSTTAKIGAKYDFEYSVNKDSRDCAVLCIKTGGGAEGVFWTEEWVPTVIEPRRARKEREALEAANVSESEAKPLDESEAVDVPQGTNILDLMGGSDEGDVTADDDPELNTLEAAPADHPDGDRPVLVNVLTGERTVGEPGEDPEQLFERMYA